MAAGHNALAGLSGPGKHSSEEGLLDLCMKVDGIIGAVGSCVKDSVGLKGSRVLGIASGWSGHGDKEVGRQEACCLGWDEDDLANVLAARSMESHTVGIAVFGENETLGLQVLLQQCRLGFANCRRCFGELLRAGSIEARRCRLREHHSCGREVSAVAPTGQRCVVSAGRTWVLQSRVP